MLSPRTALLLSWIGCAKPLPPALTRAPSDAPAPPRATELVDDPSLPQPPEGHHPALLDPSLATETAPDRFRVRFTTTRGPFVVEVHRDWAPLGVDRFYNLVRIGYYDNCSFFRTIDGFMAQFGISPYPAVNRVWSQARIEDDPVVGSNTRGTLSWAMAGPDSRNTQLFVNYTDANTKLDSMGFAAFGVVVEGMHVVDGLHKTGEGSPRGPGPSQGQIAIRGDAYLAEFPDIDRILAAEILEPSTQAE